MHSYEDVVAANVHSLIQSCPIESVSTRKELLVDFRHILATEFRKGFIPYLDYFLDENFLMGPGRQAYESLRPLAFLTIADVVHQTRDTLNFSQISRVVYLFSKNLHDHELNASIQTTSVRILVSIAERFASTHYDQVCLPALVNLFTSFCSSLFPKAAAYQKDRKLMNRMLKILALKFLSLREYIPRVELHQARQVYLESENIGDYCGRHHSLIDRLVSELLPMINTSPAAPTETATAPTPISRNEVFVTGK
jgi:hypothetical protein